MVIRRKEEMNMTEVFPFPSLPPTEAFLPLPGEPDKAAEVRLRSALRAFRAAATNLEHVQMLAHEPLPKVFRDFVYPKFPKFPPEVEKRLEAFEKRMREPGGIWSPEAIAQRYELVRPILEKSMPEIKERLLAIEQTFIERGWGLPKWKRPSWILE